MSEFVSVPLDAEPLWGDRGDEEPSIFERSAMTTARILAIAEIADDNECREALNGFVADNEAFARILAVKITSHYRLDRTTHFDDVQSLVYESMMVLFNELRDGMLDAGDVTSFNGLWQFRARQAVRRWLDSSEMNSASRQVSLKRRFKEMRQTEQEFLADYGELPTPDQVVELTNARMEATRSDARRQGVLCSMDDYQSMVSGGSVDLDAVSEIADPDPNDSESRLHAVDRARMVGETVARCREMSEVHGRIAELFFGPAAGAMFDRPPTSMMIADEVGLAAPTVRRKLAEVRHVAQEVLYTYGITGA